jgi:hypothetical protein
MKGSWSTLWNATTGSNAFRNMAWVAFSVALLLNIYVFVRSWDQSLLEMHGFRQTQTALTVYWLLQGGPWLAYETPVLGAPWAIPIEFPVYQWLVSLISHCSGADIERVGRAVSYTLFLSTLAPVRVILRETGQTEQTFPVAAALLLLAPIHLFWGRTFTIEAAALFFSLSFVALHLRWLKHGKLGSAIACLAFALLGALTKVTTFAPYVLLAGAFSMLTAQQALRPHGWSVLTRRLIVSAFIGFVALGALIGWTGYADSLKALSPLGEHLTSGRLSGWNFGTLDQRFSEALWATVIGQRAIPEAVGSLTLFSAIAGAAVILGKKAAFVAASFVAAWVSAFLIFTNLHVVHNYYQFANAALLVVGVGIVVAELGRHRPLLASGILLLTLVLQWDAFGRVYRPALEADFSNSRTEKVAEVVRTQTPIDTAILVFGYDWSGEISYYARRRSLTVPRWAPIEKVRQIMAEPASFLGSLPLSAIVYCPSTTPTAQREAVELAVPSLPVGQSQKVAGCDILFVEHDRERHQ